MALLSCNGDWRNNVMGGETQTMAATVAVHSVLCGRAEPPTATEGSAVFFLFQNTKYFLLQKVL